MEITIIGETIVYRNGHQTSSKIRDVTQRPIPLTLHPFHIIFLSLHADKALKPVRAWVALGGGGYNVSNVARAWTLAWAVMNGVELDEDLPESIVEPMCAAELIPS